MTRFARARGSKACNEKVPEEATPWRDMKRQLQESQNKPDSSQGTAVRPSVHQLLHDDTANSRTEWATIEEKNHVSTSTKSLKNKIKQLSSQSSLSSNGNIVAKKDLLSKTLAGKVKKSKKAKLQKSDVLEMLDNTGNKISTNKKKQVGKISNDNAVSVTNDQYINTKQKNLKGKKNFKTVEMQDVHPPELNEGGTDVTNKKSNENRRNNANKNLQKKKKLSKKEKMETGKPYQRRKPLDNNMVLTMNGKDVPVAYFSGFLVRKEDAERLEALQNKLKAKGIPVAEIQDAMRLERRRAEKALARERKKVCFHCRNSGHVLSECPELANEGGTGICYKCGSTEHKISECRVGKANQYRFAKCFVCSEEGHISAQCPKNARGLYPKGGGCHLCGDVTHLKRNCPKLEVQQQDTQNITVGTINGGSLEALEVKPKVANSTKKKGKNAKNIKF